MSHYAAGRRLEHEVRAIMEAAGWHSLRGAGSKGQVGGFKTDLAFSKGHLGKKKVIYLVLCQCKRQ